MTFRDWLRDVAREMESPPPWVPPLGPASLAKSRSGLRRSQKRNEVYFRVSLGLAVLLSIGTVVSALLGHSDHLVQTGLGVSAFGAVGFVVVLVRERMAFDMMLEMAVGLDEKAVREVLQVLIRRYGKLDGALLPPGAGPAPRSEPVSVRPLSLEEMVPPDKRDASPTRASLRALLGSVLVSDPDVTAFCLDHFPAVHQRFAVGMDRVTKYNKLLEEETSLTILERLGRTHPDKVKKNLDLLKWDTAT